MKLFDSDIAKNSSEEGVWRFVLECLLFLNDFFFRFCSYFLRSLRIFLFYKASMFYQLTANCLLLLIYGASALLPANTKISLNET